MSDRSASADEATRALRDIEQRRGQAQASAQESRWVSVVFGVALFAELAAPDFFAEGVRTGISWVVTALIVAYTVMLRTPRGGALLGRPTHVRKRELPSRFVVSAQLAIVAVVLLGFVGSRLLDGELFPYAGTVMGAVIGATLIIFGRGLQRTLNSLAVRGHGTGLDNTAHESR
ncbi:hypothetical protein ABZ370_10830 [Streptomyces sp. NPDC005962]|uniref:hypothetical protein n=1 Tax=Streptomyces sp. NPDC005962 TaxID=3154466 RepID=UPI003408E8B8